MNKSVVITGVSSGFGLAIAQHLLARGYRVYGSVRKREDASRVSAILQADHFVPLLFDVTDHEAVGAAAQQVAEELGGAVLGGLVNNAGVAPMGPLEHTPIQEMRDAFEVNVFGAMAVTQAFLPLLKSGTADKGKPGRIINISSTSGNMTFPMLGVYAASKYALESLNDALRRELQRYGIRVIAIEPGSIRTSIWDKTPSGQELQRFADTEYAQLLAQMPALFERQLKGAKSIEVVPQAVTRALESPRPRCRYPLDKNWYAGKHLSDRLLDTVIRWQFPKG